MKKQFFLLMVFIVSISLHSGVVPYGGLRSMGMGGCGTAYSSDSEAQYFNSGLLPLNEKNEIQAFSRRDTELDETRHHFGMKFLISPNHAGALGVHNNTTVQIPQRDSSGNLLGYYSFSESNYSLAYGVKASNTFSLGTTAHWEEDRTLDIQSNGLYFDLGFLYQPRETVKFGLSLMNLDRDRRYVSKTDSTYRKKFRDDMIIRTGTALHLTPNSTVQFDLEKEESGNFRYHAGYETWYQDRFVFRGGWDHDHFTFGLGFSYNSNFMFEWGHSFEKTADYSLFGMKIRFNRFNLFGEAEEFRKESKPVSVPTPQKPANTILQDIELADQEFAQGNLEKAKEMYELILCKSPAENIAKNVRAIISKVQDVQFQKEIETAGLSGGNQTLKGYFYLGKIYAENGNLDKGIELIRYALREHPDQPLYLLELAILYTRNSQNNQAEEVLSHLSGITENRDVLLKIEKLRNYLTMKK